MTFQNLHSLWVCVNKIINFAAAAAAALGKWGQLCNAGCDAVARIKNKGLIKNFVPLKICLHEHFLVFSPFFLFNFYVRPLIWTGVPVLLNLKTQQQTFFKFVSSDSKNKTRPAILILF